MLARPVHEPVAERLDKGTKRRIDVMGVFPMTPPSLGSQGGVKNREPGIVFLVNARGVHASRDDLGCCNLLGDGLR